jgi:hypothetical protein
MPILSVDLASRDYSDFGLVAMERVNGSIVVTPLSLAEAGLRGRPHPEETAIFLAALAEEIGVRAIGMDGPQGWKDADNGCAHARICEARLHTQGKTGPPGITKPANYLGFIRFSIGVFDELERLGWPRYTGDASSAGRCSVETFPTSAWRAVGIPPLPGKSATRSNQLESWMDHLESLAPIRTGARLTHDELQAAISGLGVLALAAGDARLFEAIGQPPFQRDGVWFEGFIVNPRNWSLVAWR